MGVSTGHERVDEHLVGMGYGAGVRGVVRRYRERVAALQELTLRWAPDPPQPSAPPAESAIHPGGVFLLENGGAATGQLSHVWLGWGRRVIESGDPEHLRLLALRILRRGGPFGGPTNARKGEQIVQVRDPQAGMRQPISDGSELRAIVLEQGMLGVRIWPSGKFAQLPVAKSSDLFSKVIEDDSEHLSFGSTRTPWTFTDLHPLVGTIHAAPYELLLCVLRENMSTILALKDGELLGLKVGSWDELRALDAGSWLAELAARSPPSGKAGAAAQDGPKADQRSAGAASGAKVGAAAQDGPKADQRSAGAASGAKAGAAAQDGPKAESAGAAPAANKNEANGETSGPKRRKRVATSPGSMPGGRARRVRIKPALAAAITQHLADVAAQLPAGVLGAAFAVELLRALEAAVLGNHPTLTGTTTELFSRLHKKGALSTIPADQAGRAALKLLAQRTPLVRRLHYRRWCLAFGDIHDPASELRARLGPVSAE